MSYLFERYTPKTYRTDDRTPEGKASRVQVEVKNLSPKLCFRQIGAHQVIKKQVFLPQRGRDLHGQAEYRFRGLRFIVYTGI